MKICALDAGELGSTEETSAKTEECGSGDGLRQHRCGTALGPDKNRHVLSVPDHLHVDPAGGRVVTMDQGL